MLAVLLYCLTMGSFVLKRVARRLRWFSELFATPLYLWYKGLLYLVVQKTIDSVCSPIRGACASGRNQTQVEQQSRRLCNELTQLAALCRETQLIPFSGLLCAAFFFLYLPSLFVFLLGFAHEYLQLPLTTVVAPQCTCHVVYLWKETISTEVGYTG